MMFESPNILIFRSQKFFFSYSFGRSVKAFYISMYPFCYARVKASKPLGNTKEK